MSNEVLLTVNEVVERYKVSRSTLQRLEKSGKLVPSRDFGRSVRYRLQDLNKLLGIKEGC